MNGKNGRPCRAGYGWFQCSFHPGLVHRCSQWNSRLYNIDRSAFNQCIKLIMGLVCMVIPPRLGEMSTSDGYNYHCGRNCEFCITVDPVTQTVEIVTWRSWLNRMWWQFMQTAMQDKWSLILASSGRLKGMNSHATDQGLREILLVCSRATSTVNTSWPLSSGQAGLQLFMLTTKTKNKVS